MMDVYTLLCSVMPSSSHHHSTQGGQWIPPSSAVLVASAHTHPPAPALVQHLLHDDMPLVVGLPPATTAAMVKHCPEAVPLSPAAVRAHMADRMRPHPLLDQGGPGKVAALQAVLLYCMRDCESVDALLGAQWCLSLSHSECGGDDGDVWCKCTIVCACVPMIRL